MHKSHGWQFIRMLLIVLICILIAISTILLLSDLWDILASKEVKFEKGLIGLIELAIATWVGLSIFNAIGKGEMERLGNNIRECEKQLEENKKTNNSLLLEIFARTAGAYAASQFMYKKIMTNIANGSYYDYAITSVILEIETAYYAVDYAKSRGAVRDAQDAAISGEKSCMMLKRTIKGSKLIKEEANDLLGYAETREGDFLYERGNRLNAKLLEKAIDCFSNALELICDDHSEEYKMVFIFLNNFIGECNNVFTQKPLLCDETITDDRKAESIDNALYFFQRAVNMVNLLDNKSKKMFSAYYRNYGTILDRIKRREEAREQYKIALLLKPSDPKIYQVLATLGLKEIFDRYSIKKFLINGELKYRSFYTLEYFVMLEPTTKDLSSMKLEIRQDKEEIMSKLYEILSQLGIMTQLSPTSDISYVLSLATLSLLSYLQDSIAFQDKLFYDAKSIYGKYGTLQANKDRIVAIEYFETTIQKEQTITINDIR